MSPESLMQVKKPMLPNTIKHIKSQRQLIQDTPSNPAYRLPRHRSCITSSSLSQTLGDGLLSHLGTSTYRYVGLGLGGLHSSLHSCLTGYGTGTSTLYGTSTLTGTTLSLSM